MTNCPIESPECAGLLLDYCSRKMAPPAAAALERHFAVCARCRAFRDGQMAVWNALDQWESLPVSAGFNRELYQRVDAEQRAPWWRRMAGPGTLRPALPLALAGVFLVAGILVDRPGAVSVAPILPGVETAEIEQIETALEDLDMLNQLAAPAS